METVGKQEKTKYKLAASMKECMKQMPVDKITCEKILWKAAALQDRPFTGIF